MWLAVLPSITEAVSFLVDSAAFLSVLLFKYQLLPLHEFFKKHSDWSHNAVKNRTLWMILFFFFLLLCRPYVMCWLVKFHHSMLKQQTSPLSASSSFSSPFLVLSPTRGEGNGLKHLKTEMQQWILSSSDTANASASQACSCLPKFTSAFCLLYVFGCCKGCCPDEAAVGLEECGAGAEPSSELFLARILVKIFWGEMFVASPFWKGTISRQVVSCFWPFSCFWSFSAFSSFEAPGPSASKTKLSTMPTISSKVAASWMEAFFKHLVIWHGCCFKLLTWLQACLIHKSHIS